MFCWLFACWIVMLKMDRKVGREKDGKDTQQRDVDWAWTQDTALQPPAACGLTWHHWPEMVLNLVALIQAGKNFILVLLFFCFLFLPIFTSKVRCIYPSVVSCDRSNHTKGTLFKSFIGNAFTYRYMLCLIIKTRCKNKTHIL